MTTNQSNSIIKNPNTKKAIAALKKYAKLETQLKAAEKEAKAANAQILEAMQQAGVERIELDPELTGGISGYITLAKRKNYKVVNELELPDEFKTLKADTDKIKAHETLTGDLPAGVETSETQYITKKIKLED